MAKNIEITITEKAINWYVVNFEKFVVSDLILEVILLSLYLILSF